MGYTIKMYKDQAVQIGDGEIHDYTAIFEVEDNNNLDDKTNKKYFFVGNDGEIQSFDDQSTTVYHKKLKPLSEALTVLFENGNWQDVDSSTVAQHLAEPINEIKIKMQNVKALRQTHVGDTSLNSYNSFQLSMNYFRGVSYTSKAANPVAIQGRPENVSSILRQPIEQNNQNNDNDNDEFGEDDYEDVDSRFEIPGYTIKVYKDQAVQIGDGEIHDYTAIFEVEDNDNPDDDSNKKYFFVDNNGKLQSFDDQIDTVHYKKLDSSNVLIFNVENGNHQDVDSRILMQNLDKQRGGTSCINETKTKMKDMAQDKRYNLKHVPSYSTNPFDSLENSYQPKAANNHIATRARIEQESVSPISPQVGSYNPFDNLPSSLPAPDTSNKAGRVILVRGHLTAEALVEMCKKRGIPSTNAVFIFPANTNHIPKSSFFIKKDLFKIWENLKVSKSDTGYQENFNHLIDKADPEIREYVKTALEQIDQSFQKNTKKSFIQKRIAKAIKSKPNDYQKLYHKTCKQIIALGKEKNSKKAKINIHALTSKFNNFAANNKILKVLKDTYLPKILKPFSKGFSKAIEENDIVKAYDYILEYTEANKNKVAIMKDIQKVQKALDAAYPLYALAFSPENTKKLSLKQKDILKLLFIDYNEGYYESVLNDIKHQLKNENENNQNLQFRNILFTIKEKINSVDPVKKALYEISEKLKVDEKDTSYTEGLHALIDDPSPLKRKKIHKTIEEIDAKIKKYLKQFQIARTFKNTPVKEFENELYQTLIRLGSKLDTEAAKDKIARVVLRFINKEENIKKLKNSKGGMKALLEGIKKTLSDNLNISFESLSTEVGNLYNRQEMRSSLPASQRGRVILLNSISCKILPEDKKKTVLIKPQGSTSVQKWKEDTMEEKYEEIQNRLDTSSDNILRYEADCNYEKEIIEVIEKPEYFEDVNRKICELDSTQLKAANAENTEKTYQKMIVTAIAAYGEKLMITAHLSEEIPKMEKAVKEVKVQYPDLEVKILKDFDALVKKDLADARKESDTHSNYRSKINYQKI